MVVGIPCVHNSVAEGASAPDDESTAGSAEPLASLAGCVAGRTVSTLVRTSAARGASAPDDVSTAGSAEPLPCSLDDCVVGRTVSTIVHKSAAEGPGMVLDIIDLRLCCCLESCLLRPPDSVESSRGDVGVLCIVLVDSSAKSPSRSALLPGLRTRNEKHGLPVD